MRPAATSTRPSATIYWQDGQFTLSPKFPYVPQSSELSAVPDGYGIVRRGPIDSPGVPKDSYRRLNAQTLILAPEAYLQTLDETVKDLVDRHAIHFDQETDNELQDRTDRLTIALSSTFAWAAQARALNSDFRVIVAYAMDTWDEADCPFGLAGRRFVTLNLLPHDAQVDVFDRVPVEYRIPAGDLRSNNYDAQLAAIGGALPQSAAEDIVTLGPLRLGRRS